MILNIYPEKLRQYVKDYDKNCPFCFNKLKIERSLSYKIIEKCNNCIINNYNKTCYCKKENIYVKTILCKSCYNNQIYSGIIFV